MIDMTIDEAIEQFKYDAECNRADLDLSYAEDNEQVAQWLEDYKYIKQWKSYIMDEFCKHDVNSFEELVTNIRNKAIDDFTEKISLEIYESIIWGILADWHKHDNMNDISDKIVDYIIETSKEIAEQLKAGGKNESK